MNLSSWLSYLPRFKDLLRPEGVSPLREADANVETVRGQDASRIALATITNVVPNLVFEGYRDWYSYEDEWILRNLGQVLTAEEEHEILVRLDQGTPEALGELLAYIADQRLSVWQTAAAEEFAEVSAARPDLLHGAANTANWHASRTPGTYYYTYAGGRYLYSDLPEAAVDEWETLPVREQLATKNAQAWGDSGWYCTPTGEPELYGGTHVYASDRDGPWMTQDQALARLQPPPVAPPAPSRYGSIERVPGHDGWLQGYDTREGGWKYARANGSEIPGDDAAWTAINAFRADGTEYFAGPGYSATGWVRYEPAPPAVVVADPVPPAVVADPAPPLGPAVVAVAAEVREKVLLPAMKQLKESRPGLTDDQAKEEALAAMSQVLGSR